MVTTHGAPPIYLDIIDVPDHRPLTPWNLEGQASDPKGTRPTLTRPQHSKASEQTHHAHTDADTSSEYAKAHTHVEAQTFS